MKTFSQFLLEATDPKGPIKKYMSPEEIAKKHKLSLNTINSQLEMGIKVESEHTGSKQMARMIALQHLEELPDYYSKLKKVESKPSSVKEEKEEETKYCPACKKAETRGECKMGPKYWDKFAEALKEERKSGDYSLRDWFSKSKSSDGKPGWVQLGGPYAGKPCARQPGQKSTPKCGSSKMAANLSDEEEERAFRRKNRKDPNQPQKSGGAKPTNVATEGTIIEKKDACYSKVKSRYRVWPSAYASGALVKCRKVGAKNWGNKTKKENYEFSNWRDSFSPIQYEFTDIVNADPIRTLKNPLIQEDITSLNSRGATYLVTILWRGQNISVQMFFPQIKRPTKNEVEFEVKKLYPTSRVVKFEPVKIDPSKALLFAGEKK